MLSIEAGCLTHPWRFRKSMSQLIQSPTATPQDPALDRTRWLIAIAAIVMQLALGAVYAWSVFVKPLKELNHWSTTEVSLTFTLAIFFLGIGSTIGGFLLDRVGPRLMG